MKRIHGCRIANSIYNSFHCSFLRSLFPLFFSKRFVSFLDVAFLIVLTSLDCRSRGTTKEETLIDAEHASFSVKITLAFAFFSLLLPLLLLSARSSRRQGQTRSLSPAVEPASFTRCTKADVQVLVLFLIFSFYLEIPR